MSRIIAQNKDVIISFTKEKGNYIVEKRKFQKP